jgi:hypothetical protein
MILFLVAVTCSVKTTKEIEHSLIMYCAGYQLEGSENSEISELVYVYQSLKVSVILRYLSALSYNSVCVRTIFSSDRGNLRRFGPARSC